MSSATITLIGLYNFDDTIFDLLQVPSGIDKQTLIDNMLLRSGDFEIMYPDPDFLKYSIGAWSRKWNATFSRWTKALSLEYNPLENYDRQEEWTDNRDVKGSESDTSNGSSNTSGTTGSATTHNISAYDAGNNLTTRDQDILSGTDSSNGSSSMSRTGSHSLDDDLTHKGRIHGNIGVTTSQQMLQSELDLRYWNIYEKITDIFLTEFVIPIY